MVLLVFKAIDNMILPREFIVYHLVRYFYVIWSAGSPDGSLIVWFGRSVG